MLISVSCPVIGHEEINGNKLCSGSPDWTSGKKFITERVTGHWNRLCKELVVGSNLTEFKECLDNICSHMV